jgi:hypothetical protein
MDELETFAKAYAIPLDNDRDRRVLAWLRSTVGDEAIRDAIGRIAGRRKPFVSNLCRVLGVDVPPAVVEPSRAVLSRDEAKQRLEELKRRLGWA